MNNCPLEMSKLAQYLVVMGVPFTFNRYRDGLQIKVKTQNMDWDAVCNDLSYGHEVGFLEIMDNFKNIIDFNNSDDGEVEGWLTADDIAQRVVEIVRAN